MITQKDDELTIVFDIQGVTEHPSILNPKFFFNANDPSEPEKTKLQSFPYCKPKRHGYIFISTEKYKQNKN